MAVDSEKQAFLIPARKITSFGTLREYILSLKNVQVKSLQRLQGKCISLSLAVPAAKLYIRNMNAAIASSRGADQVKLTESLRGEILHWRFLDTWTEYVPWRDEKHVRMSLSTDASNSGWGCVIHGTVGDQNIGDYWNESERELHISSKEMMAICHALDSAPAHVRDCRVDIQVDSRVAIDTFNGQGSRKSPQLTEVTKKLYQCMFQRNLQLELVYVPSEQNQADGPSRRLVASDAMLSKKAWEQVERAFGGSSGHSIDLMALDSNVQLDKRGARLPHFTPWPTPRSHGVNLFTQDLEVDGSCFSNPYVFPPFSLIAPVLKFLSKFRRPFTIVVPGEFPRRFWWPTLMAMSSDVICLALENDPDVLLFPSKEGFKSRLCRYPLYACRVSRF